jgi:hypothetical protein
MPTSGNAKTSATGASACYVCVPRANRVRADGAESKHVPDTAADGRFPAPPRCGAAIAGHPHRTDRRSERRRRAIQPHRLPARPVHRFPHCAGAAAHLVPRPRISVLSRGAVQNRPQLVAARIRRRSALAAHRQLCAVLLARRAGRGSLSMAARLVDRAVAARSRRHVDGAGGRGDLLRRAALPRRERAAAHDLRGSRCTRGACASPRRGAGSERSAGGARAGSWRRGRR